MDAWKGSFAQSQLEKFGWNKGDGLGKNKDGKTKHISVTKKNDKKGVGVGQDQWEFAWWDHLFNKSASGVIINKDEDKGEVNVSTKKHEMRKSKTGIISTVRPSGKSNSTPSSEESESDKSTPTPEEKSEDKPVTMMDSVKAVHQSMTQKVASANLYGAFVKSTAGVLDPSAPMSEQTSNASSKNTSDVEVDDEFKDYSVRITDAELFAACEGRTARKGGRGLVEQTGKFARVMVEYLANRDDVEVDQSKKSEKRKFIDEEDDTKPKEKKAKKDKTMKTKKSKKSIKEKKSKKDKDTVKPSKVKVSTDDEKKEKKKEKKEKKDKKAKKEKTAKKSKSKDTSVDGKKDKKSDGSISKSKKRSAEDDSKSGRKAKKSKTT
ncbi:hypothetical protein INT43_007251 [Umbelopsis isabellina]|uniref:G-patch domain-containing protein n=1 Tax=Mortierella isabellina TaxID=91625 RepID=A0A8H7PY81_MORIS|nr:hypothetical protein INT43_007251 [Umbelopsis isabellina]